MQRITENTGKTYVEKALLLTVNCALFRQICQGVFDVFLKKDKDLLVFNIQLCFVRLAVAQYWREEQSLFN